MKNGLQRFVFFLDKLEILLLKASVQKNPALWLYSNDARTPLFMLEGLAKLYSGLHNKKKFEKIKAHFKLLEDAIGAIDYYDAIAKDFKTKKNIPATVISYLQAQTREKIQSLNELLNEKNWVGTVDNRLKKIRKKLEEVKWLDPKKEAKELMEFYGEAIYDITEFAREKKYHYENMETEVHELRRRLRWLSIYPQALKGLIQLTDNNKTEKHLKKYLTEKITSSPFNKMPDAGDNAYFLLLNKNYFLSLSWMIAELGTIKDNGLAVIALKEALMQTDNSNESAAIKKAYQLLGQKQEKLETLLGKADAITKTFFEEHNLEQLVAGVSKVTSA